MQYGSSLEKFAPFSVIVTEKHSKPVIHHNPPADVGHGESVELSVQVEASVKLAAVRVYYKRMPASHEWLSIQMQPAGGSRYTTRVPLTAEGLLYYFEAIDEDGNGAHYPDFLKETPYFAIEGWDPRREASPVASLESSQL